MNKLVESFLKIARIIVVICLFILAAFQIVSLFNGLGNLQFWGSVYSILVTALLLLLYLVPAILLAVKKDKEGLITLSFLLGYLVISNATAIMGGIEVIGSDASALIIIRNIFLFVLGVLFAIAIICLLFDKGFGTKLMKVGNLLLVVSLFVMLIAIIFDLVCTIAYDTITFKAFFQRLAMELITPLIIVFGLMLVGKEK